MEEDEEEVDMDVSIAACLEDRKIVEGVRRVDWEVGVICYGIPAWRRNHHRALQFLFCICDIARNLLVRP